MEHAFNQYQSNQQFDQSNLESRKSKLETQLDKIEERYAIGEIGADLYQKYTQKYSDELADIDKTTIFVRMVSDFACPWCYVGHKKLNNSAKRFD